MQDQDYDLAAAPERKVMGLPAKQVGAGMLVALVCFLYAYGIETQEFICSFGASERETPELGLIIIGLGRVGRQLLDELLETTMHSKINAIEPVPGGPRFRILCLGDSTATLCSTKPYVEPVTVDVSGMDARQLAAVLHHKQDEKLPLRQFHFTGRQTLFRDSLAAVESMPHHLPGGGHIVVVDLSGSELTGPTLVAARRAGFGSVIANKKVLAGSQALYNGIAGPHMWNEATVGSAVPVVMSLRRLLMTGDHLHRIEGVLSGTIEFILGAMQKPLNDDPMFEVHPGAEFEDDPQSSDADADDLSPKGRLSFSQAVREAIRRGYSEADPREDLSGMDVARKALIIARMQGWDVELEDINHEPLAGWGGSSASVPVEDWLADLEKEDERWAQRVAAAEAKGHVLRYVMSLERTTPPHTPGQMWHNRPDEIGLATVEVREVNPTSTIGRLHGTDNVVTIESDLFKKDQELVLRGPVSCAACVLFTRRATTLAAWWPDQRTLLPLQDGPVHARRSLISAYLFHTIACAVGSGGGTDSGCGEGGLVPVRNGDAAP